eukprot:gene5343-biopygen4437
MPSTQITTPYAALLLRLSLGTILLAHGAWLMFGVFGLAGTMGYFGSIGYPPVFGALVAFGETAAGLALITGVLVRPAALLSLPILIGATLAQLAGNFDRQHAVDAKPHDANRPFENVCAHAVDGMPGDLLE